MRTWSDEKNKSRFYNCKISRTFCYPSAKTFSMPIVKSILKFYVGDGKGWADPFSNNSTIAEYRNDLCEDYENAQFHMDAVDFLKKFENGSLNGALFDPPYSLNQSNIHYGGRRMIRSSVVMDEIARIVRKDGIVISFGWNSTGLGYRRGFEKIEITIINHGGRRNDTIVVVERKIRP